MLQSLHIKNVAIIDELEIEFGEKLNVLTGETGTGKTIIINALELLLGGRTPNDVVRTGSTEATIVARFFLGDEEIIIDRTISVGGKGKIFINGMPATQAMLKKISTQLIDISSQHEHQLLLDPETHVAVVDRFGHLSSSVEAYRAMWERSTELTRDVAKLVADEAAAKERIDFLRFQRDELVRAKLEVGEEERLMSDRSRLKHAVTLGMRAGEVHELLYGDQGSVAECLGKAERLLEQCEVFDATVMPWRETLATEHRTISDVARELERYLEKLGADPETLAAIEERLHLLASLKQKYGGSIASCLEKLSTCTREIDVVERFDEVLSAKQAELDQAKQALITAAEKLSRARRKTAARLSQAVADELGDLGMKRFTFEVRFTPQPIEQWSDVGPETIEFFISPNVGEGLRSLAQTASGGELSRILLAIKRVLGDNAGLAATYVFDEVDAGIGGATAAAVGKKLREVAESRQVICITHLPQVAAFGSHHYRIAKRVAKGRTIAELEVLTGTDRREEIARMLGGSAVTDAARRHAAELMKIG